MSQNAAFLNSALRHRPAGRKRPSIRSSTIPSPTTTPNRSWPSPPAETSGSAQVRLSHPLFSGPQPSGGSFFGLRARAATRKPVFDFRAQFCHSAPTETHAFGFSLRANAPEGQKRFPISSAQAPPLSFGEGRRRRRALLPLLRSPCLARLCSNLYAGRSAHVFRTDSSVSCRSQRAGDVIDVHRLSNGSAASRRFLLGAGHPRNRVVESFVG